MPSRDGIDPLPHLRRSLLDCVRGLHLLLHHLRQLFLDRLLRFRRLGRQIVEFKM